MEDERKESRKKKIFLHMIAVAKWEGSVSFGDVTSLCHSLVSQKVPPGGHKLGKVMPTGQSSGTDEF